MTMKLSEAIRLGSLIRPQGFGNYRSDAGTCALGAAMDAVHSDEYHSDEYHSDEYHNSRFWAWLLVTTWAWLLATTIEKCPVCSTNVYRADALIVHLNDQHKWTRERIADYVETIEPKGCIEEKKEVLEEVCV